MAHVNSPTALRGDLTLSERHALEAYRLRADLTYRELAEAMAAADCALAMSKIHELVHDASVIPNARTTYKVRMFLKSVKERTT